MADDPSRIVTVEIMGQRYPIRSALDIEYITHLASYVDEKIQSATELSTGADTVRIAVLAALNIANHLVSLRESKEEEGARQVDPEELRGLIERIESVLRSNAAGPA